MACYEHNQAKQHAIRIRILTIVCFHKLMYRPPWPWSRLLRGLHRSTCTGNLEGVTCLVHHLRDGAKTFKIDKLCEKGFLPQSCWLIKIFLTWN